MYTGVRCCIWGGRSQLCADIHQGAWFSHTVSRLSAGTESLHRHSSLGNDCCVTTLRQDGTAGQFTAILYWISLLPPQAWRSICAWIALLGYDTDEIDFCHIIFDCIIPVIQLLLNSSDSGFIQNVSLVKTLADNCNCSQWTSVIKLRHYYLTSGQRCGVRTRNRIL